MGFESSNVIINLGLVFIFIIGFALVILLTLIVRLLVCFSCRYQDRLKRFNQAIQAKLYWNLCIRFFIETYLDQAFVQALKLVNIEFTPLSEGFTSVFAILIMLLLVSFPPACWALLIKHRLVLNFHSIKKKYETAYENVRTSSKAALAYTSVFMLKRLLFAAFVMVLETRATVQTFLVIHLFFVGNLYTFTAWPFQDRVSNLQECFNDYMELQISYCLIVMGSYVPNKKTQYNFGWVVCAKIGFSIAVNLIFILSVSIKTSLKKLKVILLKYKRRIKQNGWRNVFKKLD